eukprot:3791225-Lingulodinium_polyedra.AAC.1
MWHCSPGRFPGRGQGRLLAHPNHDSGRSAGRHHGLMRSNSTTGIARERQGRKRGRVPRTTRTRVSES